MKPTVRKPGLFPDVPSLLSGFFDDDFFPTNWRKDFQRDWTNRIPASNVKETDSDFTIELAVPGMDKEDFNIDLKNGVLTISAEKKEEKEDKDGDYTRQEFNYTSFTRSFNIPDNVNEESIRAKYDNGMLNLVLPKMELATEEPNKTISIS